MKNFEWQSAVNLLKSKAVATGDEENVKTAQNMTKNDSEVTTYEPSRLEPKRSKPEPSDKQKPSSTVHYILKQPSSVIRKANVSYSQQDPSTFQDLVYQIDPRYDTLTYSEAAQKKRSKEQNSTIPEKQNPRNIYDTISYSQTNSEPGNSKPPGHNHYNAQIQYEDNPHPPNHAQHNSVNNVKSNSLLVLQNPSGHPYNIGQNFETNRNPQVHAIYNGGPSKQPTHPIQIIPFNQNDPNYLNTVIGAISSHLVTQNQHQVANHRPAFNGYQRPSYSDYIPYPPNGHYPSPNQQQYYIGPQPHGYSDGTIRPRRPNQIPQNDYKNIQLAGAYARANAAGYGTYPTEATQRLPASPQHEYPVEIDGHIYPTDPGIIYRSSRGPFPGHVNVNNDYRASPRNNLRNIGGELWEINPTFINHVMPHLNADQAGNHNQVYTYVETRRNYASPPRNLGHMNSQAAIKKKRSAFHDVIENKKIGDLQPLKIQIS